MNSILYYLIIVNCFSFLIYGIDKWLAIAKKRRVSEMFLLLTASIGGTLGAIIGMLLFRHKIAKVSFLLKFVIVVILQISGYLWIFKQGI